MVTAGWLTASAGELIIIGSQCDSYMLLIHYLQLNCQQSGASPFLVSGSITRRGLSVEPYQKCPQAILDVR